MEITPEQLKKIPKGRHRVTDFIIYRIGSIYRDPYSFVYRKKGVKNPFRNVMKNGRKPNPIGHCNFFTGFSLNYLFSSAKSYLTGSKISKELYRDSMKIWAKKKKKVAKDKPTKSGSHYPIAKNIHFFIKVEGLGDFYFQMVYNGQKKHLKEKKKETGVLRWFWECKI